VNVQTLDGFPDKTTLEDIGTVVGTPGSTGRRT